MPGISVRAPYPRGPAGAAGGPNVPRITGTLVEWQDGAGGYLPAVNYQGPSGPNGSAQRFRNRTALEGSTLGDEVEAVDLLGYFEPGDFGASRWVVLAADPGTTIGVIECNNKFLQYAEWIINVCAFGFKDGGDPGDNVQAIQDAIDFAPATGAVIVIPPGSFDIDDMFSIDKPITLRGSGSKSTILMMSKTTGPVCSIAAGYVTIECLGINSSVTRAANSWYIDVTTGDWVTIRDFEFLNANCGIRHNGTTWTVVRDGIMQIAPATGTGIKSLAGQGIIADNVIIAGIGLDVNNQAYAGFDLSFTGDSVITNCSTLVTGYGILAAPGAGQTCSAVLISNTFFDTARVGCGLEPTAGSSVALWRFNQCWFSTANYHGVSVAGTGGGLISDICFKDCILASNGDVSGVGKGMYFDASGGVSVQNVLIDGCMIFNSHTTDIETLGTVVEFRVVNNKIGHTGFQSANGLALGAGAEDVRVLDNVFGTAVSNKYLNLSSGTNIKGRDNIGLADFP